MQEMTRAFSAYTEWPCELSTISIAWNPGRVRVYMFEKRNWADLAPGQNMWSFGDLHHTLKPLHVQIPCFVIALFIVYILFQSLSRFNPCVLPNWSSGWFLVHRLISLEVLPNHVQKDLLKKTWWVTELRILNQLQLLNNDLVWHSTCLFLTHFSSSLPYACLCWIGVSGM
jgi:hypothetical protein